MASAKHKTQPVNELGVCQSCGRDYSGELLCCSCPADDCPSHWEEQGKAHPEHTSDSKKAV